MNAFQSRQNGCTRGEAEETAGIPKDASSRKENQLENEYPFTLDLIYHRRQPELAALTSLLVPGFGGLGQLLLGQESRAGVLFLVEWLVVFPLGLFLGGLPYLLLCFHLFVALDAWVLSRRVKKGRTLQEWEWWWIRVVES